MGCICRKKPRKHKENRNASSSPIHLEDTRNNFEESIFNQSQTLEEKNIDEKKRTEFIDCFFAKSSGYNAIEEQNTVFITSINKKMHISKDSIIVDEDFILKVNLDIKISFNNFLINLDANVNEIISREIYIDNIKVDDSRFEIQDDYLNLEFENTYNQQTRKVRIIEKIQNQFDFYGSQPLIVDRPGIAARYLIYLDNDLSLDDISNKNYIVNKDLNLAFFEGVTTDQTEKIHGYINYSKKIDFKIYQYIPELTEKIVQYIIQTQEAVNKRSLNIIANYKKTVFTDYGQDVEEIFLEKVTHPEGYIIFSSLGLYNNIRNEIDSVEINNKPITFRKNGNDVEFNDIICYNNQFLEIHLKYKYYFNEDKNIFRQENVISSNHEATYYKSIVQIPADYVVISTNDIFQKSTEINNTYVYQGIINKENIVEIFKFCHKTARWEIEQEIVFEAAKNIERCEFEIEKVFKGGNLKELRYDIINEGAFLIDSGEKYVFKYENLNTNKAQINWKIRVENSTSNYFFNENKEYFTHIPPDDIEFFKNLVNLIISTEQSNFPNYKKIGKWVHNYIKYNLQLTGAKFTAMQIYNNKQGVCEHFTILYNTLLTAYGIDAIKVNGFAKNITEYNTKVKKRDGDKYKNENTDQSGRHAWTLAKIDGEWVPLDATLDIFDKKVPITHVYENYGDGEDSILYNLDNIVEYKRTKEIIKFVKSS